MNFKISVIIPCFNSEKTIEKCINSLINQTIGIENLQLIFVNDASSDSTIDILVEYEKRYPESILVIDLPENCKQGGARNIGLSYAQAEYIAFVDSDDWIEKNMYEIMYNKLLEYKCDLVSCGMYIDFEGETVKTVKKTGNTIIKIRSIEQRKKVIMSNIVSGVCSIVYSKKLLIENCIYFPEKLAYEDNYFVSLISFYANSIYTLDECFYHYNRSNNSTTTLINAKHHFDRLKIELMKIQEYKKRNLYEIFSEEIEWNFIQMFYVNTLNTILNTFTICPSKILIYIEEKIKEMFPLYKENKYYYDKVNENEFTRDALKLLEVNLNEEQWEQVFKNSKVL